jgi:hypothetical protein
MEYDRNKAEISYIINKAQPKIDTKWKNIEQNDPESPSKIVNTVGCLRGQDREMLEIYQNLTKEYESAVKNITSKKIYNFKSIKSPSYSEYNIGIAFIYILACVDDKILLSSNKKEIFDISWDSVVKTLSNAGEVCKCCRRLRVFIEKTGINEYFVKYIKYHLEN